MADKPEGCSTDDIEITPEDLEAFEDLFRSWQMSWPVCDLLEVGAMPTNELKNLARDLLLWAESVLSERREALPSSCYLGDCRPQFGDLVSALPNVRESLFKLRYIPIEFRRLKFSLCFND